MPEKLEKLARIVNEKDATTYKGLHMFDAFYKDVKSEIEKVYKNNAKAKNVALLFANTLYNQHIKDIEALGVKIDRKKSDESSVAKEKGKLMKVEVDDEDAENTKRLQKMKKQRLSAWKKTNPARDDAYIDDYEGWDTNWVTDNPNKTRSTLSGWIAAYKVAYKKLADSEMERAKDIYDDSLEWLSGGYRLDYEPMVTEMGMESYIDSVQEPYGLADESAAFIAAYLKIAENNGYGDAYDAYVRSKFDETIGLILWKDDLEDPDKIKAQLEKLAIIMTPPEWKDRVDDTVKKFVDLKKTAKTLKTHFDKFLTPNKFEYKDGDIKKLFEKKKGNIGLTDRDGLLINAHVRIKQEATAVAGAYRSIFLARYWGLIAKLTNSDEKTKKKLEAIKATLDLEVHDTLKSLEGYVIKLYNAKKALVKLENDAKEAKSKKKPEEYAKKKETAKKKKRKRKSRKKRSKVIIVPPRRTKQKSSRKRKPSSPEKNNIRDRKKFLKEYNLVEAGEGSNVYVFGSLKYKQKPKLSMVFGNPDLEKYIGKVINPYLNRLDPKVVMTGRMQEIYGEDEQRRFAKAMMLVGNAYKDFDLSFKKNPTLSQLKNRYMIKLSIFTKVGKEIKKAIGDYKTRVNKVPTEAKNELAFLGEVHPAYVDAVRAIVRNGDKPGGVGFMVPFEGYPLRCKLVRNAGGRGYKLFYSTVSGAYKFMKFPSVKAAARGLNSGAVNKFLVNQMIIYSSSYASYKNMIGTVKSLKKGDFAGESRIRLGGWPHKTEVFMKPLLHGRISYMVTSKDIHPSGADYTWSEADNFKDLMNRLASLKRRGDGSA